MSQFDFTEFHILFQSNLNHGFQPYTFSYTENRKPLLYLVFQSPCLNWKVKTCILPSIQNKYLQYLSPLFLVIKNLKGLSTSLCEDWFFLVDDTSKPDLDYTNVTSAEMSLVLFLQTYPH